MNQPERQEMFHVASRATGQELFSQSVSAEWFRQDLVSRTLWAAAIAKPTLRGKRLKATLEPVVTEGDRVVGWLATLSSGEDVLFCRRWPVAVLHGTALAVGQQYQRWLGDGRVLYWVALEDAEEPANSPDPAGSIEFGDEDPDGALEVPAVATPSGLSGWRVVAPAAAYPTEAILALKRPAYQALLHGVTDARWAETELAWAGAATVGYLPDERILVYQVADVTRLAAPDATASLCPVRPEALVDVLDAKRPVVFFHTHVVPEHWRGQWSEGGYLACSGDDLRCFRRLPVGSLSVIVGSRPPLALRAYGWPADAGELGELNTTLAILPAS